MKDLREIELYWKSKKPRKLEAIRILEEENWDIEEAKENINSVWLGSMGGKKEKPLGFRIEMRGRIRGAAKRTKWEISEGSIRLQSAGRSIEYNKRSLLTKWGVLGLKVIKAGN